MTIESTQEKILEAARRVFLRKGMDGARMQEIADEAGINKSLLHYYFRTKQHLFDAIFEEAFGQLVPNVMEIFKKDGDFFERIEAVVEEYDAMMSKNPFLPLFVIYEINRDPEHLSKFIENYGFDIDLMAKMFEKEAEAGHINPISVPHLLANMLGMIIMPYIARPLLERNLFHNDAEQYDLFLTERKKTITYFIKQALQVK